MAQVDPFGAPMVFLRVTWMDRYRGITGDDDTFGGGDYVKKNKFGHEIFNFQPFENSVYGCVRPSGREGTWPRINLNRMGAVEGEASISNVLVIWVAKHRAGGTFIVGWYANATVYRSLQPPPSGAARQYKEHECGYYITAKAEDAVLLDWDSRLFRIPKGGFGRSHVWYANDPERHRQFRLDVLQYVQTRQLPESLRLQVSGGPAWQPDPLLREKVEQNAVEETVRYFTDCGYAVTSVEQDNIGWDLIARARDRELKLEVKGLSGSELVIGLTPDEYAAMKRERDSYRLCVVRNALSARSLSIFAYSRDSGRWESSDQEQLEVEELTAARCRGVRPL